MASKTDRHVDNGPSDPYADNLDLDVLVVGAGFGGVYLLHRIREELGLKVKIFEAGSNLGGTWFWNRYPGARVDSPVPIYALSIEKCWKDWTWSHKYPDFKELQAYFQHVGKVLDIKKDVAFNTRVTGARFDENASKWNVQTEDGRKATCKYLILAIGFAAKTYLPDWKGIDTFEGTIHHSARWPVEGVDTKGKRVAVIGTGASGVQIIQETAPVASELTVFQRTPNLCLPMRQRQLTPEEQDEAKKDYPQIFRDRLNTHGGFPWQNDPTKTFDHTPEEREAFFETLWQNGGFWFWNGTYADVITNDKANDEAYNFWARKTRARVQDPEKRDLLAPLKKPHAFGTKRPSLEQNYYEQFNRPNVSIVDVSANPVVEIQPKGIVTADGKLHEVDIIALATGFDSVTGGMKNIDLVGTDGVDLTKRWKLGTWSYLGMTVHGYPNMFFLYGPQAPTGYANGPSAVEQQANWVFDVIVKMRNENLNTVQATKEAEETWRQKVLAVSDMTLLPNTKSWYMGTNIPGKPKEQLMYLGGLPLYEKDIRAALAKWEGFVTA